MYVTVSIFVPELTNVWFRKFDGVELFEKPVTSPEEPLAVQVKSVPLTFEVRLIPVAKLLHLLLLFGLFERSGVGFTVKTLGV